MSVLPRLARCLLVLTPVLLTGCYSTHRQAGAGVHLPDLHVDAPRGIDPETGALASPPLDDKTDKVTLKNGDTITCELKSMSHGIVTAKTDSMSTVYIEWVDVMNVESRYHFRIETTGQQTYYGNLAKSSEPGQVVVDQDGFQVILEMLDIVLIEKFKTRFLDRITGYINFGYQYAESTTIDTLNFAGGLKYKSKYNILSLDVSTIGTSDTTGAQTSRADATVDFKRFFTGGLYGYSTLGFQHNSEMGIALRSYLSLGAGVAPIRSSVMALTASAGLNGNNEAALGGGTDQTSLEAVFGASYQIFVFKSPKTDLDTTFTYYPSITEERRYRINYDIRLRQEVVKDFFIDFKFYLSYDSDPPSTSASNRDYGFITGIGYSW